MTCKLIAEIGWNHMGDMALAEHMVEAAGAAGADYAKFQSWNVKNLKKGPWDDDGRRKIYDKAQLSRADHFKLLKICEKYKVKFLTSCFYKEDLDVVEEVSREVKIPSTECFNNELVESAIERFDHVYISTGASTKDEYEKWIVHDNVTILHCVSAYPCKACNINIPRFLRIKSLTPQFGYSGHYAGIWDAVVAVVFGATIVEKHFTTDQGLPGRDNKFAIMPADFAQIRQFVDEYEGMKIDHGNDYQECEEIARSVYARRWCGKD